LATVGSELGELRTTPLKEIMAAQKKPLTTWKATDLGIDLAKLSRRQMISLAIPQRESKCEMVTGGSEQELGVNLALKLREKEII
jgi:electron transfer flavoprotein alpha/beta subunit